MVKGISYKAGSLVKGIFGKGVRGTKGGFFPLVATPLFLKGKGKGVGKGIFGKGVMRAEKGYRNTDHMDKTFSYLPSFKQYRDIE